MEHERQALRSHAWLSANHISVAHSLLKKTYPNQNGLMDTSYLADKFEWCSSTSNFVQIINVGGFHWACLSNKFTTDPNTIQLYDSLLTVPGATIKEQACTILNCKEPSFKIQVMNVQLQKSPDSCGLYAIAMAFDLSAGTDPCSQLYEESLMRSHLEQCFNMGTLSRFPGASNRTYNKKVVMESVVDVFCVCRYPDVDITDHFGDMASCDSCGEWFHQLCVDIPNQIFKKKAQQWLCSDCQA